MKKLCLSMQSGSGVVSPFPSLVSRSSVSFFKCEPFFPSTAGYMNLKWYLFYHAIVLLAFTHLKHTSDFKVDWKGLARNLLCYAGVYMLQPNEEGGQPRSRDNVQEYLAQWDICMPRLKRLRKLSLPTILKFPSWSSCREIFIILTVLGKHRWGKAEEENSCIG